MCSNDTFGGPFMEANAMFSRAHEILKAAQAQGFVELEIDLNNEFLRSILPKPIKIRVNLPAVKE